MPTPVPWIDIQFTLFFKGRLSASRGPKFGQILLPLERPLPQTGRDFHSFPTIHCSFRSVAMISTFPGRKPFPGDEPMSNLRYFGEPPFRVAVLHGGPGISGEMAPVAQELSSELGVLEPLQTKDDLKDQVEELRTVLDDHGDDPFTVVGY